MYLAQDTKLDRRVAIKLLNEEFSKDPDKLKRFIQEAKSASALNHPNILTVYEIGEADGKNYIATELIDGHTLREQLSEKEPLPLNKILKISVQVAEALSAAHAAGIIHRDIKPENIMIRRDGYAKVLDFGLAKLSEPAAIPAGPEDATRFQVNTTPGVVMGTVFYMSPEQARGNPTDARTDIWSLGVVLFEMIARRVPFSGETVNHTIVAILEKEPVVPGNAPPELQRILRKAMTKDVEMRYQSARDLLIDLKNLRRDLDIQGEIERSIVPDPEATNRELPESEGRAYTAGSAGATRSGQVTPTESVKSSSSLEYAVNQATSHKLATSIVVLALLGVITTVGYFAFASRRSNSAAQISSIAVMPFVNASGNADVEYLSDGMTETLISSLSQVPNLSVKSASTVFHYKGKETPPKTIGDELSVQAVLLGRVMQRGDELKLSLELVNTQTQNVIWSEQYNRKHGDLVTLQSDIARDVSQKLERKLSGDAENLAKKYTSNPEAYELYLRGRYHWSRRTVDDDLKALEYFEKAVKADPNFALAYVGISDAHLMLGIPDAMAGAMSPAETIPPAREAAEKAIELDPSLAEAYASRGHVRWKLRDWSGAEADFRRSIELNPNYSYAHLFYAIFLAYNGRIEEGLSESKRSVELDQYSIPIVANYSYIHYLAHRPDEAIAIGKRAVAFDDTIPIGRQRLGLAYEQKAMMPEAISEFEVAVKRSNRVQLALASLAHAYAVSGNQVEARKILAELEARAKQQFVSSYLLATVYAGLGDKQRAIDLLENAYTQNSIDIVQAKMDPKLDPLREDPRFQELIKKIGFP